MDVLETQVDRMLSDRRPFEEIEDRIEGMSVSDDKKAALWLLAWSGQAEWVRRRTVAEALTPTVRRLNVLPQPEGEGGALRG
jgi:hypothetical protein